MKKIFYFNYIKMLNFNTVKKKLYLKEDNITNNIFD